MGLRHDILSQPVTDLPLRTVVRGRKGMTVREAVTKMRQASLGFVVVCDEDDRPLYMFTERMLIKIIFSGAGHLSDPIDQYFYKPADCIGQHEPIARLMQMMRSGGLRFVCVVDDEGKIVAVTGQKGMMEYIADHFPRQVKVQEMDARLTIAQREGA